MARERFIDPAGQSFEIDTDLLASHGNALQRFDDRRIGRRSVKRSSTRSSTRSSRYGELPGGEITVADFKHGELHLCAHGQRLARCSSCGVEHCACPGTLPHQCGGER